MSEKRFYLSCIRERVGSNEGFWCIDSKGYTTDLNKAHVYTLEEAQAKWNTARKIDIPLDADKVDVLAVWKIDFQYIPHKTTITDEYFYVAFVPNKTDGNDLYWLSDFEPTTNFSKAKLFNKDIAISKKDYIFVPHKLASEVERRTLDFSLVNYRKMTTSAGLKTPEYIKRFPRITQKNR